MSWCGSSQESIAEDSGFEDDSDTMLDESSPPSKLLKSSGFSPSAVVAGAAKSSFRILTRMDVLELQESFIRDFIEVLPMSPDEAFIVLTKYNWSFSKIQDDWFNDETSVRTKSGLPVFPISAAAPLSDVCGICLCPIDDPTFLPCMHKFCKFCFVSYLEMKIQDGQESVQTRCPGIKCPLVVPRLLIESLVSEPAKVKYSMEWCVNWFVTSKKDELKFCPNPSGACDLIIQRLVASSNRATAVLCNCGYEFCFSCGRESHLPTTCVACEKWTQKNSSESENVAWIIANTKPCPGCRKPIEKNQGCNHMRCQGCMHEYCWICLKSWASHSGSYYNCNMYHTADKSLEELEKSRAKAKSTLQKYVFHFERFMNHQKATILAQKDLNEKFPNYITILHERYRLGVGEVEFIRDALIQVVACRQVLKWSYVYAFYMDEDDDGDKVGRSVETRELFDYLQKNLEEKTDKLHELVEKDLAKYVEVPEPSEEEKSVGSPDPSPPEDPAVVREQFLEFRSHVCNYLNVTKNFRTKIVSELNIQ